MFEYIGYVLKAPLNFAKRFLQSPISSLFYSVVGQWYFLSMTLSVIVLYWVIIGLNKAGVTDFALRVFTGAAKEIKGFAQFCIPLVTDISAFVDCAMHTPEYTGDETTNYFERSVQDGMDDIVQHPINHDKSNLLSPYELLNDREERNNQSDQNKQ